MIKAKRIVWLDILRVFSAFAIVSLHVSSYYLENSIPFGSASWCLTDLYLAFTRFAVPVFVMISGVFFLNPEKEITLGNVFKKYVFRMLTVWLGWAALRTLIVNIGVGGEPMEKWAMDFFVSLQWYWFLPMIMGLYIFTPLLRPLVAVKKRALLVYFMVLSLLLATVCPVLEEVEQALLPTWIPISSFTNLIKIPCLIFGAHFMFGYYVCTYGIGARAKKWLYAGAWASLLLMTAGTYAYFNVRPNPFYKYATFGASITPFAFLLGAGLFVWVKELLEEVCFSDKAVNLIQHLAYYSLGVYMCHLILVDLCMHYGWFKAFEACPVVMVGAFSVLLFVLSNGIIALLYQIPGLKKHLL